MESSAKQILVIGGSSSLVQTLCRFAKDDSYEITATFRGDLCQKRDIHIKWLKLELSDQFSVEKFLDDLNDTQFDKVFFMIGAVTKKHFLEMSYSEMMQYYSIYIVNALYLLQRCLKNIKSTSSIIVMSSRSASNASYDVHYSAAKAALESYVRSSARALAVNQSIVGISSGLIQNSRMYFDMKPEHRESHKNRAGGRLITVEELCLQLWSLSGNDNTENNGRIIDVGPVY
jgi:NAD(P)-dependent dehydrogenase (short-subunit alcohol dehydrogenase family)